MNLARRKTFSISIAEHVDQCQLKSAVHYLRNYPDSTIGFVFSPAENERQQISIIQVGRGPWEFADNAKWHWARGFAERMVKIVIHKYSHVSFWSEKWITDCRVKRKKTAPPRHVHVFCLYRLNLTVIAAFNSRPFDSNCKTQCLSRLRIHTQMPARVRNGQVNHWRNHRRQRRPKKRHLRLHWLCIVFVSTLSNCRARANSGDDGEH